jgi:disulfide bond formation protein DsbB
MIPTPRTVGLLSALAAALALATAWMMERWAELAPCALCLLERWPYRVAIVLGLLAAVSPRGLARILLGLVAIAVLADIALAVVHVGVEQHFWPSPLPECAAPAFSGGSIADMLKSMPTHPAKPCDAANFLIPGIPLSIAALNLLYGLMFLLLLGAALWRGRERDA